PACGQPAQRQPAAAAAPPPPQSASAATVVYACDNGEILRAGYPDPRTAIVDYRGRLRTLVIAPSTTGARYVGEGLQWQTVDASKGAVSPLGVGETMASGGAVECALQGHGAAADAAPAATATNEPAPVIPAPPAPGSPAAKGTS